jgi:hypothetical protein
MPRKPSASLRPFLEILLGDEWQLDENGCSVPRRLQNKPATAMVDALALEEAAA